MWDCGFVMRNQTLNKPPCKAIAWSYPTSTWAKQFGFNKTGCYVVELTTWIFPPQAVAGYATKAEAIAHARTLSNPWQALYLNYYPNDI